MTPKALSREIKFRMWSIKDKFMDDTPVIYKGAPCTIDTEGKIVWMPQDDTVLMQFTGLHDKNGKEIYEGDVVELQHWEPKRYEVVFNRGGFCLKFGEDSHFYPDIKYAEDSEVIGNIYEHPYLLTKENK